MCSSAMVISWPVREGNAWVWLPCLQHQPIRYMPDGYPWWEFITKQHEIFWRLKNWPCLIICGDWRFEDWVLEIWRSTENFLLIFLIRYSPSPTRAYLPLLVPAIILQLQTCRVYMQIHFRFFQEEDGDADSYYSVTVSQPVSTDEPWTLHKTCNGITCVDHSAGNALFIIFILENATCNDKFSQQYSKPL